MTFLRKRKIHSFDEAAEDLEYWLSKPVRERACAIAFIVAQSIPEGARMNKEFIVKHSSFIRNEKATGGSQDLSDSKALEKKKTAKVKK